MVTLSLTTPSKTINRQGINLTKKMNGFYNDSFKPLKKLREPGRSLVGGTHL